MNYSSDSKTSQMILLYATFGKAIYLAQCLEMAIANHLTISLSNLKEDITKTRYDEILTSRCYQTFGQLKQQLLDKEVLNKKYIKKINLAHEKRDWLAHNYWWDRSYEFNHDTTREKMISELETISELFEELNNYFFEKDKLFLENNGVNIQQVYNKLKDEKVSPLQEVINKPSKNEKLLGVYFHNEIPVFKLDNNGFWTFCEIGLFFYKTDIDVKELIPINDINKILPADFNPRPKKAKNWNYEIILNSGYFIEVRPSENNGYRYKWKLRRKD